MIFQSFLLNLIKKGIVHFLFAILAYVNNDLWEKEVIAYFAKQSWEHEEDAICKNSFFSNLKLGQERWRLPFAYYTDLYTGLSTKDAIHILI